MQGGYPRSAVSIMLPQLIQSCKCDRGWYHPDAMKSPSPAGLYCVLFAALVAVAGAGPATTDPAVSDPAALLDQIRDARLEPGRAVTVESLTLRTGLASFEIRSGVIFPAAPVGGRVVEMVFAGDASIVLEPPDPVEAGQLELFTGAPGLDEKVGEAVLVVALDTAADALTGRASAVVDPAASDRASELFERWKVRPERRLLGVETAVLRDALGDPGYGGFFAGWFRGEQLGEFLYLFEPDAREQVALGRFSVLEASDREKRKLARQLHRQQRQGRLIGLAVEDLGRWDTWLSASSTVRPPSGEHQSGGEPVPGARSFEPVHYEIEATLSGPQLSMYGRARIHLERRASGRMVTLEIHPDLHLRQARLDGEELFYHQVAGEALVVLPVAARPVGSLVLEVEYAGEVIDRIDSRSYALANTTHWYPHAGSIDMATYEVIFRWPEKIDLLAAGELIEAGREGGRRFERRRLDRPSFAFSFEVGRFRQLRARAGHVDVTLGVDALGAGALDEESRRQLLATITDSLRYFEQLFGPYPLDRLTVVTAAREFSQSLVGFITLSTLGMLDADWTTLALGLEDRRTIVAHEIAHQWWGHIVGWSSYRDQWISEAMANHAAVLYARHRLRDVWSQLIGPTAGWQEALTRGLPDGRTIESLGPLVLGERLVSSRSQDAYQAIVYQKGAIVLEMLSRAFGEQTFLEILRQVVRSAAFTRISTETFLAMIEQLSGRDLTAFAEQFIYGTGLPEVYYTYGFSQVAGRWRVRGVARQQSPYRYRHRAVELAGGGFDVARERLDQIEVGAWTLVVPFELAAFDPAADAGALPADSANVILTGGLRLEGEVTEFDFEVEYEPKELWLDRDQLVFGRFFNQRRHPKRALYYQGIDLLASGEHVEAEAVFRRGLAADVLSGAESAEAPVERERLFDAGIHLELARLYLDQGRPREARAAFDRVRKLAKGSVRFELGTDVEIVEARLALRGGLPERAYRLLRKTFGRGATDPEGLLLLAIAARATGRPAEFEAALEAAKSQGADVAALLPGFVTLVPFRGDWSNSAGNDGP